MIIERTLSNTQLKVMASTRDPFFSIGITTYNRRELLKQALESVIKQTFTDFEVIVGNDYTKETLSPELLDIEDSRIKFINHSENIKEIANMNSLLSKAKGRYFTWLNDDDLYAPDFFEWVFKALQEYHFPACVFTSYRIIRGTSTIPELRKQTWQLQNFSGSKFLTNYFKGKLKVMAVNGVFDTAYLQQNGGVKSLCTAPIGLYGEYLLLVSCGLLKNLVYIDGPLVLYRNHETNWTDTNTDVEQYKLAGENLICESARIFSSPELRSDFIKNLSAILKLVFQKFVEKATMKPKYHYFHESIDYYTTLKTCLIRENDLYLRKLLNPYRAIIWFSLPFLEGKFKTLVPTSILKFAYKVHSYFQ